jgi:hypothetical protein
VKERSKTDVSKRRNKDYKITCETGEMEEKENLSSGKTSRDDLGSVRSLSWLGKRVFTSLKSIGDQLVCHRDDRPWIASIANRNGCST